MRNWWQLLIFRMIVLFGCIEVIVVCLVVICDGGDGDCRGSMRVLVGVVAIVGDLGTIACYYYVYNMYDMINIVILSILAIN